MSGTGIGKFLTGRWLAAVMILIGIIAIAVAVWEFVAEQDGTLAGSAVPAALGVVVAVLGVQRYRSSES